VINVKGQSGPPEQIKYVEESNPAVQEKMKEMIQLCQEGQCPPWIQILLEQADSLELSGKAIKDIVIIPITQASNHHIQSVSKFSGDENSQHAERTWELSTFNNSESGNEPKGEIYLLKLEKRLK